MPYKQFSANRNRANGLLVAYNEDDSKIDIELTDFDIESFSGSQSTIEVVLAGKNIELNITLPARENKPLHLKFLVHDEKLYENVLYYMKEYDKDTFKKLAKSGVQDFCLQIRAIEVAEATKSQVSVSLQGLPKLVKNRMKLNLYGTTISFLDKDFTTLESLHCDNSHIDKFRCELTTDVQAIQSSFTNSHIGGSLNVHQTQVQLSSCKIHFAKLNDGKLAIREHCTFASLSMAGDSELYVLKGRLNSSSKLDKFSEWNQVALLHCLPLSDAEPARLKAIKFKTARDGDFETAHDIDFEYALMEVSGGCEDVKVNLGLLAASPSSIMVVNSGAGVSNCHLEDMSLAMEPTSSALEMKGNCHIAYCHGAYLQSDERNHLCVHTVIPSTFQYAKEKPYDGAILISVEFVLEDSALPGLVALEDAALLDSFVGNLMGDAKAKSKKSGAGIGILNRAIAKLSTLGSIKTRAAYAAADFRSRHTGNLAEWLIQRFLSGFGYAQRPRLALLWWLTVIVLSMAMIHLIAGPDCRLDTFGKQFNCFLALVVEPFNLFKVKAESVKSIIP